MKLWMSFGLKLLIQLRKCKHFFKKKKQQLSSIILQSLNYLIFFLQRNSPWRQKFSSMWTCCSCCQQSVPSSWLIWRFPYLRPWCWQPVWCHEQLRICSNNNRWYCVPSFHHNFFNLTDIFLSAKCMDFYSQQKVAIAEGSPDVKPIDSRY